MFVAEHEPKQRLLSRRRVLTRSSRPSSTHSRLCHNLSLIQVSLSFLPTHLLPVFGTATWHPARTASVSPSALVFWRRLSLLLIRVVVTGHPKFRVHRERHQRPPHTNELSNTRQFVQHHPHHFSDPSKYIITS